jgi:hypothetical protein
MEPSDLITSDGLMQQENIDSVKRVRGLILRDHLSPQPLSHFLCFVE